MKSLWHKHITSWAAYKEHWKSISQKSDKWYRPSEIAKKKLIVNSKGNGDYRFVLRLIDSGSLRAANYASTGDKEYWLVKEDDIEDFLARHPHHRPHQQYYGATNEKV